MESKSAVALTYESLYELLRREKEHEELQKLDPDFFETVLAYIREKQQLFDDAAQQVDIFSISERDKLLNQLSNIRRLVKELYDRREKKILEMALNKSRTNSAIIDTSHLLDEERQLFQRATQVLQGFRQGLLQNILELREPDVKPAEAPKPASKPVQKSAAGLKRIVFLQQVGKFVDTELNPHGPFEPNAVAELPANMASVLIAKGFASEFQE